VPPSPASRAPTFGIVSLGCDKNTVDTERYRAELSTHGAVPVDDLADADLILVNTCGFIDAAKRESIDALIDAGRLKRRGRCRGVVAVGCMVERHRDELAASLPEVDLFVGTSDADTLIPSLTARGWLPADGVADHPGMRAFAGELPHVRYLKVSEGCDHGCAFCAIPLMRGRHRSFALDALVREAQLLELQGAREVNLVAQDLAHYGRDLRTGLGLPDLLTALIAETSIPWIRLLYVYAAGLDDRVLDTLAREPRMVRYLDIPIQHGSDAVLRRMRRPERAASIRATVARIRDAVPGIALRTTCIVGFPGETEDDARMLLDLLEEVQFDRVGVFAYSAQDGTRAAQLPDDVPDAAKRERLEQVTERQRLITAERYDQLIGTTTHAMVDWAGSASDGQRPVAGGARARLACQADDIDGITTLDRSDLPRGSIVDVCVDDVVDDYDFVATVRAVVSAPVGSGATEGATATSPLGVRRAMLPIAGEPGRPGSYGR
jgi:ribosomal protein S12 methylthiotransferase